MAENVLKQRSFQLAINVVQLYKFLISEKKEYVLSKQFLRSGTSIGANIREAQNAESTMDFIHKLHISQKECDETIYWLELLQATGYLTQNQFTSIQTEATIILKMLRSAILTTKEKIKKSKTK